MWVCLSNSFLSIVDDGKFAGKLVVRARRKGDVEKVFPGIEVKTLRGRDYQFRGYVGRKEVAAAMHDYVMGIDYNNFKNSVEDNDLHHAYHRFWDIHAGLQPKPPYRM